MPTAHALLPSVWQSTDQHQARWHQPVELEDPLHSPLRYEQLYPHPSLLELLSLLVSSWLSVNNSNVFSTQISILKQHSAYFHETLLTIIFGSVAYLGSLSLRSALTTAGNFTFIVSSPPSISLVTCSSPFCFSTYMHNQNQQTKILYECNDNPKHTYYINCFIYTMSVNDKHNF